MYTYTYNSSFVNFLPEISVMKRRVLSSLDVSSTKNKKEKVNLTEILTSLKISLLVYISIDMQGFTT